MITPVMDNYFHVFLLLFAANLAFLLALCRLAGKSQRLWFQRGFIAPFIISLVTLFFVFRPHFEQYSERMNQFHLSTLAALIITIIILSICGHITDRNTSWSLHNGIILIPLSLLLAWSSIELVQIRIFFWTFENPGTIITSFILFFWLFLVIGFFEILSSSDWLFIIMILFYNSILKVLFYYMDFPPVIFNDFMLMTGLVLIICKLVNPSIRLGSTVSLSLGLIQGLIPVITRLKRFTFITFISPFFLITMLVIIIFINFYWRSLLFRGPKKL